VRLFFLSVLHRYSICIILSSFVKYKRNDTKDHNY